MNKQEFAKMPKLKYQGMENTTTKPVKWYVDISSYEIEARTRYEAEQKALALMKNELPDICNIELVDYQETEGGLKTWK